METIDHFRALRTASLEQARALREAVPRQTSARVVELMLGEAERLEGVARECRRQIGRMQGVEA